jgi:hypothetical protein
MNASISSACLAIVLAASLGVVGCAGMAQSTGFDDSGDNGLDASSGSDGGGSSGASNGSGSTSSGGPAGSSGGTGSSSGSGSSAGSSSGAGSGSSSGSSSNSSSGGNSSGSSSGSGSSSSSGSSSGGSSSGTGACAAGLQDKITTCTAGTPACNKGCGPDVSPSGQLGTKSCSCNGSVYNCALCAYPSPLPACYQPASTTPPACASGVASGAACISPCSGVCTMTTDAGKTDGCVCVMGSSSSKWSCATQWW